MPTVSITADLPTVLAAVTALNDGVRHDEALALLESVRVDNDHDRLALDVARAEVVWRQDWLRGRRAEAVGPLDAALALAAQIDVDQVTAWDLAMLTLRRDYANALVHPDGSAWFGPEGRVPGALNDLAERARSLHETAPDSGRRGWALMSRGWIADNLAGDRQTPAAFYAEALQLGRESADGKLVFDAQRHLGDHLHEEGDHEAALAAWEESAQAAARAGHVTGVRAQQNLLAALAREQGQTEGAAMLAAETRRWARAIGATRLAAEAEALLTEEVAALPSADRTLSGAQPPAQDVHGCPCG